MHRIERIFLDELADFEQVPERPAHADHLRFGIHLFQPRLLFELLGEKFLDFPRRFLGRAIPREQIRERHRSEGKRRVIEHVPTVVIDDFRTSAADLQNQPLGNIHRIDDAAIDERRFLFLRKHADLYIASRLYLVQKGALIFCAADRRRRNRDDSVHRARIAKALEHFQRLDRLRHSLRLQKAVSVHILTETHALFQLVHDHEMPFREQVDDDQSRRIGTQIDNTYFFHFSFTSIPRKNRPVRTFRAV